MPLAIHGPLIYPLILSFLPRVGCTSLTKMFSPGRAEYQRGSAARRGRCLFRRVSALEGVDFETVCKLPAKLFRDKLSLPCLWHCLLEKRQSAFLRFEELCLWSQLAACVF